VPGGRACRVCRRAAVSVKAQWSTPPRLSPAAAVTGRAGDGGVRATAFMAGYDCYPGEMRAREPEVFGSRVDQGRAARERYEAAGEVETISADTSDGKPPCERPTRQTTTPAGPRR
jgi:hypothetical protein